MKNAFARMGRMCASVVLGGGLIAGSVLAANNNQVAVDLPHEVTVGSIVLPTGHYTITGFNMSGEEVFVVRNDAGKAVTLSAQSMVNDQAASNTQVVFSKDGDTWHFDKLVIAGDGQSYQFNK